MKCELQKEFLDISDELKQQMEIEKNDLIHIQMELYLFLTNTYFEMVIVTKRMTFQKDVQVVQLPRQCK
ncbi:unnamed protein product [Paramecium sonneborni]|uniref:Uncharacterized protein n=1 Tax=Paramecium sonneborni TaxID=65129 RepID=A0A8S1LAU6_9CILI|nr:unnamed protein product [Paramecium sonneborni]